MRQSIGTLLVALFLVYTLSVPAAAANKVNSIDIESVLYKDGSMHVTQVWKGDFDEGTEAYIPINAPDYLTISGLQVSDGNGTYETIENWAVEKSFEKKTNTCGINDTDSGYEVCWGISQYGNNRYVIEYTLHDVIGSYSDMDGVNFRFVNDGMNTTPTDVNVEIRLADGTPITDEIADIWGFGFEGQVEFADGAILAYTENPVYSENHVTVMLSLNKGILSPARQEQDSFETVKQTAFEGSDYEAGGAEYEEAGFFEMLLGMAILIGSPTAFVIFIRGRGKKGRMKKLNQFAEKQGYFRDIPNGGNANAAYLLGRQFEVCEDGSILAMGMLRLLDLGCLSSVIAEESGLMDGSKEVVNLRLMGSQHGKMNEYDEYLYTVLESAAGADGVLQSKELERFANTNDKVLRNYINKCSSAGKSYLNQRHCFKRWDMPSKLKYLTPQGEKELGELLGFRKYLEDFSLIAERGIKEIPIWKELLSYAMLFGIADRLARQMKELYPDISADVSAYSQSLFTAYSCYDRMICNMRQAEQRREQEKRAGGSGGFSSLGGGGGSIGGGSGGGTR